MSIQELAAQAKLADDVHLLTLRRYCQHIAIRVAAEHPERLFTLDDLRPYDVLSKTSKDSRWRVAITKELHSAGLLEQIGYEKSEAPGRGKRPMMKYRLTDNMALILDWLDTHPTGKPERSQGLLFE